MNTTRGAAHEEPARFAEGRPSRLYTWNFAFVCGSNALLMGNYFLLAPALPLYAIALGATEVEIGLVLGVYNIGTVFSRTLFGREADRHGRRRFLLLGGLIYLSAAALYPLAWALLPLLAVRAWNGVATAAAATGAVALVADLAPPARRGEAVGIFGLVQTIVSSAVGAISLGLVRLGGWTALFAAAGLISLGAILLSWPIKEPPRPPMPPGRGAFFSMAALFPTIVMGCFLASFGVIFAFVPVFGERLSMANVGLTFFAVYSLTLALVRFPSGWIADRLGRPAAIVPGLLVSALSMAVLAEARAEATFSLVAVLYGIAFGLVWTGLTAWTIDRVPESERGLAMASLMLAFDLGIGVGAPLFGLALAHSDYPTVFRLAGLTSLLGLGLFLGRPIVQRYVGRTKDERRKTKDG